MVKWGETASDPATDVTIAIMDAVDRTLRALRPGNPHDVAIAGLLGALLAVITRDLCRDRPEALPGAAREVATQLIRASTLLASTLSNTNGREAH